MKTLKFVFALFVLGLSFSCQQPSPPPAETAVAPVAPDHSATVKTFLAAMDAGDSLALFANCTDNFKVYHPNYPAPLDRAGFMNHIRAINAAFSGVKHTAEETVSSATAVAARGVVAGKHTGAFNGIPASNNDIKVDWLSYTIMDADGKWEALYIQFNQMSFMAQMGVQLPGA